MSVIDKANEYVGHPREVDEGYEVSMRRTAYAQGYQDAMDKACELLKNVTVTYNKRFFGKCEERAFDDAFIKEFRELFKI